MCLQWSTPLLDRLPLRTNINKKIPEERAGANNKCGSSTELTAWEVLLKYAARRQASSIACEAAPLGNNYYNEHGNIEDLQEER